MNAHTIEDHAMSVRNKMMADLPKLAEAAGGDGRGNKFNFPPVNALMRRMRRLLASRWRRDTKAWEAGVASWNARH